MTSHFRVFTLLTVILVCCPPHRSRGEVFTAISDCEPLMDTHQFVIERIEELVRSEENKLMMLKKQLNTYKTEHQKAIEDVANYLGNPINTFTIINRLTNNLKYIDRIVKTDKQPFENFEQQDTSFPIPTEEDLIGAAQALTRLQATYKLEVTDLAEGILNGVPYSSPMSADDCWEIGRVLYEDGQYSNSIAWMKEALRKYQEDISSVHSFTEIDVYGYGSRSYYELDDFENALDWTRKLLVLEPNHARAAENEAYFVEKLEEKLDAGGSTVERQPERTESGKERFGALCRGDFDIPREISKKLFCFYLTEKQPFLRLAPIKAEQKYANPDVFVYYDIISDDEISYVKAMAKPRFQRAGTISAEFGINRKTTSRISKVGWLYDSESPVVARISRRVADFTGLLVTDYEADDLQVANYGIGGFYVPHYDFTLKGHHMQNAFDDTNRIATVLFYLSEVSEGGATVFTELGLSVFPIKNAALVWRNLHPSGEGDLYTRHAACPVLRGSKWVANKWIHSRGQELVKSAQCTLEYQAEELNRVIPKPTLKASRK